MLIVDSSYTIDHFDPEEDIRRIASAARLCYKSPELTTYKEQCDFVSRLIRRDPDNPHLSPLEHSSLSVLFVVNRGVSHEAVRHRLMSPNQESTRYCNYSYGKFNRNVTFIKDRRYFNNEDDKRLWLDDCASCELRYFRRLNNGHSLDEARGVLNNDVKTELLMTANYREWRHILKLRSSKGAHYQFREVIEPLKKYLESELPCVFEGLN